MKKRFLLIILSIFVVISTSFILRISKYYASSCDTYAENGIKGELSNIINKFLFEHINDNSFELNNLTNVYYSEQGKVNNIIINTVKLNSFAVSAADEIYSKIKNNEYDFGIPLGNALGYRFLSGKGFRIPVKVIPISYVTYKINSELLESGINQTLHRISVDFEVTVECIAPFNNKKIVIANTVIITETLIVGNVPQILLPSF